MRFSTDTVPRTILTGEAKILDYCSISRFICWL